MTGLPCLRRTGRRLRGRVDLRGRPESRTAELRARARRPHDVQLERATSDAGERSFAGYADARFQLPTPGIESADAPVVELAAAFVSPGIRPRSRSGRSGDATVACINRVSGSDRDADRALNTDVRRKFPVPAEPFAVCFLKLPVPLSMEFGPKPRRRPGWSIFGGRTRGPMGSRGSAPSTCWVSPTPGPSPARGTGWRTRRRRRTASGALSSASRIGVGSIGTGRFAGSRRHSSGSCWGTLSISASPEISERSATSGTGPSACGGREVCSKP